MSKPAFILDKSKSVIMQVSNDTFFYLKDDEPPLDEANLDEANEILEMFPNGFIISDNWEYVENESDIIQVTFIPYIEKQEEWDGYAIMFNGWILNFKIANSEFAYIQHYNKNTGEIFGEQDASIEYYYKKPWLCYPPNEKIRSMIPLFKDIVILNEQAFTLIKSEI